jgi:hypothetical protein
MEEIEAKYVCSDCKRDVDPDVEHCFAITDELLLCYECSVRRGGAFDELHDKWARAPKLEDVPLSGSDAAP